ncbi:MAG TPA: hypothetical protein VHY32_10170 [Caulobacteraceae bacterium]|nr:hypothetical protein [Caulobacteraceae bacterium]
MVKPRRKPPTERPRLLVNDSPLTAAQEQDWRRANDDIASGDFARAQRGVEALRALEAALRAGQIAASVGSGLNDTIALEKARGEVVEVAGPFFNRSRVRIRSRDGLETLHRSGAIDGAQFKAGMLYRDLYEAADPERDLRSQMNDLGRVASTGPKAGGEAWQERRLRLAGAMASVEAKVRIADRNGGAVRALREVAGHARCVSHLSSGGGGQATYRRALGLALDIAADHFGLR